MMLCNWRKTHQQWRRCGTYVSVRGLKERDGQQIFKIYPYRTRSERRHPRDQSLAPCSSLAAKNIVLPFRCKRGEDCLTVEDVCDTSDEMQKKGRDLRAGTNSSSRMVETSEGGIGAPSSPEETWLSSCVCL
jgi:hypothetical protein